MGEDIRPDIPTESNSGPVTDAQQLQSQISTDDKPAPPLTQYFGAPHQTLNGPFDMAQPQGQVRVGPGPFNMGGMVSALPQGNYRQNLYNSNPMPMNYNPAGPPSGMMGQAQPMQQYGAAMGQMGNQHYYTQQSPQPMQPYYGVSSAPQSNISSRSNMSFYGNQPHPSMGYYYPPVPAYGHQAQMAPHQRIAGPYVPTATIAHDPRLNSIPMGDGGDKLPFSPVQQELRQSPDSQSNVVRGPPRKPRQTGHAIWIGNLPTQTSLMDLVHHVCREAEGLESLFLISKSNCAFANYKDEALCSAAQQKLHESKFQSVRLVSRLRKNTVEGASGVTAPTGPAAAVSQPPPTSENKEIATTDSTEVKSNSSDVDGSTVTSPVAVAPVVVDAVDQKDKFFILKSLTLEDLNLSVKTGVWATQSHNEETLNAAFKSSENVYLVFSANKSGEYFGYARMTSTINEDPDAKIQFGPQVQPVSDVDLPKEIPTDATETTPKGRIIDDSARGTIFWEVTRDDVVDGQEQDEVASAATDQDDTGSGLDGGLDSKTWGKPFKLEWLCTTKLPFYRCRGLRNSWNANREVKIARDGTQLEPSIGRRLIGLFNRPSHISPLMAAGPMMGMGHMMPPVTQPMGMGYPPPYA